MAVDMMSLINRELAKIEKYGGGKSSTPVLDELRETMRYAKEDRAWKERKNMQRQDIMSSFAKDTNRLYNNEDVKIQKERLQKYYNKHKGSMDETSLEIGQMYLDNFEHQEKKNDNFSLYEARQDAEMEKVINFTDKLEVGKEYSDKDLEEFKNVVTGYTNYTEEFAKNHSDRLQLKANQHINKNLAHGSYVNDYMLDSFFDDKKIDKVEYKAFKESIARNTIQPIVDYNEYQAGLIKSSSKALVEEIEGNVQLYKGFQSIQNNATPLPKEYDPSGEATGLLYDDAPKEIQDAIDAQVMILGKDIDLGDKTHTDRHGTSYVDYQHEGLFKTATPTTTSTTTPTTTTKPISEKKENDIETVKAYMQSGAGRKVKKEYEKSKRLTGGKDMTEEEFLENRPVLLKESVKKAKEHSEGEAAVSSFKKNIKTTMKNYNDLPSRLKTEYSRKQKSISRVEEIDGKKRRVRYSVFIGNEDGEAISRQRLDYIQSRTGESRKGYTKFKDIGLRFSREVLNPYTHKWENKTIESIDKLPEGI